MALTACDGGNGDTHTHTYSAAWEKNETQHWKECSCTDKTEVANHNWQWEETTPATLEADGLETETCSVCGETKGTRPIPKLELADKTYTIELKDGALEFVVEYKALETDEEPAYLAYIEGQLTTFMNSTSDTNVDAVNLLLTKGNSFDITIEYEGDSYPYMNWDTAAQSFKMHNDWISTASGAEGLTNARIRDAFNSVVIE